MSVPYAVVGQSLRINATLDVDMTEALTVSIKYRTPAGATASVSATVDDAATGQIHADISGATLATAGDWYFMAEATFAGSQTVKTYGKMVRVVAEYTVVEL